jgi:predicted porin
MVPILKPDEIHPMKNSIILLSVVSASSAAVAQSSVSLSGTMDVYATRASGSLTKRSQVSSGGNSTSKLILRATEDLGGGLKAGFWLEAGLSADTGLGMASNSNNQPSGAAAAPAGTQGLTFNRRSIVTLGGNWGEVQAGRNWSPTYETFTGRFDVFGVGSGIGLNFTSSINPNHARVSNSVAYITPRFLGFSANVQKWFGENASNAANSKDGGGEGLKINFDQGNFGMLVAVAKTRFITGDAIYRNAAAIYNFGVVRLTGNVTHDQQGALKKEGALAGVVVPIGVGEAKASYSFLKTNAATKPKGEKFAVGYVYNLSKRSAIYTTLARIENKRGSALSIAGSTTAPDKASTALDLGLRHNF